VDWITLAIIFSRSGTLMLGLMWPIGRPTSDGIKLSICSAAGVNRRICRSADTITIGMCTFASRFKRSLLTWESSSFLDCSSSFSVLSSSFVA